jgi:hypothetical protein
VLELQGGGGALIVGRAEGFVAGESSPYLWVPRGGHGAGRRTVEVDIVDPDRAKADGLTEEQLRQGLETVLAEAGGGEEEDDEEAAGLVEKVWMLPTVPGLRPTAQVLLKSRKDAVALVRRSKEGGPTMEVASVQVFLSLLKLGRGRRQAPGGAQPGTGKDGGGSPREAPSDPYGHGHMSLSPSAPGDAPWYPNGGPPMDYGPQEAPLYGYGQWESYAGYSAWGSHPPEAGPFWSEASAYQHWAQHVAPHWA